MTCGPSPRKIQRVDEVEDADGSDSDDDAEDEQDDLDDTTCQALSEVLECQQELKELDDKEANEISQVVSKYSTLCQSYYDKREAFIEKVLYFWGPAIINHSQINTILLLEGEELGFLFCRLNKLEVEEFLKW